MYRLAHFWVTPPTHRVFQDKAGIAVYMRGVFENEIRSVPRGNRSPYSNESRYWPCPFRRQAGFGEYRGGQPFHQGTHLRQFDFNSCVGDNYQSFCLVVLIPQLEITVLKTHAGFENWTLSLRRHRSRTRVLKRWRTRMTTSSINWSPIYLRKLKMTKSCAFYMGNALNPIMR